MAGAPAPCQERPISRATARQNRLRKPFYWRSLRANNGRKCRLLEVTGGAMRAKSWESPLVSIPTAFILALALIARAPPALADDFPSRPITILVPLAAGG